MKRVVHSVIQTRHGSFTTTISHCALVTQFNLLIASLLYTPFNFDRGKKTALKMMDFFYWKDFFYDEFIALALSSLIFM